MQKEPIFVLLADDDEDDRLFFVDAFEEIKINTVVKTVKDGVELLEYLFKENAKLPDVLFLDLNMPRKTGVECLVEIKKEKKFDEMAIAIYSTSASDKDIEDTFVQGANVYIKKPNDFGTLKKVVQEVITVNWHYQTSGLNRENFFLSL